MERKISTIYPGQIKRYEKEIDQIGEDIKLLNQSAGSDFSIVLDGKRYTERSEAGEAFGLLYRMIKEGAKDNLRLVLIAVSRCICRLGMFHDWF